MSPSCLVEQEVRNAIGTRLACRILRGFVSSFFQPVVSRPNGTNGRQDVHFLLGHAKLRTRQPRSKDAVQMTRVGVLNRAVKPQIPSRTPVWLWFLAARASGSRQGLGWLCVFVRATIVNVHNRSDPRFIFDGLLILTNFRRFSLHDISNYMLCDLLRG